MFGEVVNADIANRITTIKRFLKKQGPQSSGPSAKFPAPVMFPNEESSVSASTSAVKNGFHLTY
jgi:hypothetical protein